MTAYAKFANDAQEQLFAGLNQLASAQEQLWTAAKAGKLQEELPTPAEVVENAYGFAGRLLDFQKSYALRVASALDPKA